MGNCNNVLLFQVDVGPPPKAPRRAGADGELELVERLLLFDFMAERDNVNSLPPDMLELMEMISDAEEFESELNAIYLNLAS